MVRVHRFLGGFIISMCTGSHEALEKPLTQQGLENTPPPWWGISANIILGKNMKSGKRKKRRAANRFSKVAGELQTTADKNFKIP
jgi:hypothetical protein